MSSVLDALKSLGFEWQIALANTINFLIIFYILKRFFFDSLKDTLSKRQTKIEQGIKDAETAKTSLLQAEEEKKEILKDAHKKSDEISKEAETKAKQTAVSITDKAALTAQTILEEAESKKAHIVAEGTKEIEAKIPVLTKALFEKMFEQKMTQEENEVFIKKVLSS